MIELTRWEWFLMGLPVYLLISAGAVIQVYLRSRKLSHAGYVGFMYAAGTLACLATAYDSDTKSIEDVAFGYITMLSMGVMLYAFTFPKDIVLRLKASSILIYQVLFWSLLAPPLLRYGTNPVANWLTVYPSAGIGIVSIILSVWPQFPRRKLLELLCYSWVSVFLLNLSIYSYRQLSALNLQELLLSGVTDVLGLLLIGGIFVEGGLRVLSVLMMLPIFWDKHQPYTEEIKRARMFRGHVNELFVDYQITFKETFLLALFVVSVWMHYTDSLPESWLIYVGISLTAFVDRAAVIKD